MKRAAVDLLVCLVIQILVLTGIGGAAHSATMAAARSYALCGAGGAVESPDGPGDRHCMDCAAMLVGVETGAATVMPEPPWIAREPAAIIGRVAWDLRPGARRIRAPPMWRDGEI